MTEEERFQLDLNGWLLIKGVLDEAEIAELNAIADERMPYKTGDPLDRRETVSTWHPATARLIDHPRIHPYLVELVDSKYRLDHDYCIFMQPGAAGGGLHGGPDHAGDHWYKVRHDGKIRNGLSVLTYFLTPAKAGDGGFLAVPGSHKSNFPHLLPRDVAQLERRPHYVVQPEVDAGDVLFFTEALIHGTAPWTAAHERRALLFKYAPGNSAWLARYPVPADYPFPLTDRQKRILAPPSVGNRPDVDG